MGSKEIKYPSDSKSIRRIELPWPILIYFIALLCPTEASFYLGSFRVTPYRIFLLISIIPCFIKVYFGKSVSSLNTDKLFICYVLLMILALSFHHGLSSGLQSGGILMVESLGSYLLARVYLRTEIEFSAFIKMLLLMIVCLTFITLPESLTGKNLIRNNLSYIDPRMGFHRAFGTFDHPILYGVFCASALSLIYYVPTRSLQYFVGNKLKTAWVILATFLSVSSGALFPIAIQLILIVWDKITKAVAGKWRIFSFILILFYFSIDILSNRSPILVILWYLTFNKETAYNRIAIWEWGTKYNVAEHPWLGIGFKDWVRLSYMSPSMDNFWLVNMVQFGLPAFFFLSSGILILMIAIGKSKELSETVRAMRTGWMFSMIGFIFAGCTVHFWNNIHSWFFFLLGSGAWIATHRELNVTLRSLDATDEQSTEHKVLRT